MPYKIIKGSGPRPWKAETPCETKSFLSGKERENRFFASRYLGKLPRNMCWAHLCFNYRCSNPEHLVAIPQSHNLLMDDVTRNGSLTEYKCGHPRTAQNSYKATGTAKGSTRCRMCTLEKGKQYDAISRRKKNRGKTLQDHQ